jgi:hypothetical protein
LSLEILVTSLHFTPKEIKLYPSMFNLSWASSLVSNKEMRKEEEPETILSPTHEYLTPLANQQDDLYSSD